MKPILGLLSLLLVASPAEVAFAADAVSVYTHHDYNKCRLVRKDAATQSRRCKGIAGIPINYSNGEDDSVIDFGRDGLVGEASWGDEFAFAGKTIEWRGFRKNGRLEPYAAIVRFDVGRSIGGPFRPRLEIFRLEGDRRSCLAASVDGRKPDANRQARKIADDFVATFDCDKDKMRQAD
jgi:hypothetical protein